MEYKVKDIEKILYSYLPEEEGYSVKVIEAMNYAFKAGGKRLRPLMMRLCYDMFATKPDNNIIEPFMAAIEMIHTYSLIHDDLPALDNDELRRGKPTVHVKFGEDIAILAGDGLLNYAFFVAAKAFKACPGNVSVENAFTILTEKPGIHGMIGGQTLDVIMTGKPLTKEQLEYIYINKTSALIECAMTIGATLAGADDESVKKIREAALTVGMAFQVQDDILDIVGNSDRLGKPVLSDEKNGKFTYATIHGVDAASEYVNALSEKANRILEGIRVNNTEAKKRLMELITLLIHRDR